MVASCSVEKKICTNFEPYDLAIYMADAYKSCIHLLIQVTYRILQLEVYKMVNFGNFNLVFIGATLRQFSLRKHEEL